MVMVPLLKGSEPTTRHNFGSKPAEKPAQLCIWFIWNVRKGAGTRLSAPGLHRWQNRHRVMESSLSPCADLALLIAQI